MSFFSRHFSFFRQNHTKRPPVFPEPLLRLSVPAGQEEYKNVYVMSDLHGQYDAFLRMLWKIRFHPDRDLLILAGDLIDCGPDSCSMLEYARLEPSVLVLRGNHEQDLINAWSSFGLQADPSLFARLTERRGKDAPEEYVSWLSSLPCCCSLTLGEKRFLIAHAAPPSSAGGSRLGTLPLWRRKGFLSGSLSVGRHHPDCRAHADRPFFRQSADLEKS